MNGSAHLVPGMGDGKDFLLGHNAIHLGSGQDCPLSPMEEEILRTLVVMEEPKSKSAPKVLESKDENCIAESGGKDDEDEDEDDDDDVEGGRRPPPALRRSKRVAAKPSLNYHVDEKRRAAAAKRTTRSTRARRATNAT